MSTELKDRIKAVAKDAMRQGEDRLGTLRLVTAAIKREVDGRVEMDDDRVPQVLTKMVKQRRDSITQYTVAVDMTLAAQEQAELAIIGEYRRRSRKNSANWYPRRWRTLALSPSRTWARMMGEA